MANRPWKYRVSRRFRSPTVGWIAFKRGRVRTFSSRLARDVSASLEETATNFGRILIETRDPGGEWKPWKP